LVTPPAVALSIADWAEVTADAVAVKLALVAFAGTSTVAGTVRAVLLLDRVTFSPPEGAADVRVTLQVSEPAPVREALVQLKLLSAAVDCALSSKPNVSETPAAVAVRVTVWVEAAGAMVAVKLALVALAGTSTLAGIETRALLLLERVTVRPADGAGAVNVTLQVSVPAPVIDGMLQVIALRATETALS
jgi:hypothetical protein